MYQSKKESKKEFLNHVSNFLKPYSDTGIKKNEITGRYIRSGARGCRFHPDKKWIVKYKSNLSGINLLALESPQRLGVSEIGNFIRFNLSYFNKYSNYKKLSLFKKVLFHLTLKFLPQSPFDLSLSKCKKIHQEVLKRKRKVLDTMQNK